MDTSGLFNIWVTTISFSIVFIAIVSFYLYTKRKSPAGIDQPHPGLRKFASDFVFVWVLLALLIFYIVTISVTSPVMFAVGNIAVELVLILYIVRSKKRN